MKNIFILAFILFFCNGIAYAQDYYGSSYSGKKVSLGITAAPNYHWLRYGEGADVKQEGKIGYSYGLLSDFALTQNYYFSTGFLINNVKSNSNYSARGNQALPIRTYHLQYVEVPFAVKLQSTQRYYRSYYGQFGFSAGIKVSGDVEEEGQKTALERDAKNLRLALQIGGGINWQLDHGLSLMTGLSFNNGFTEILKEGKPKSSYVAFNVAIFF